MRRLTAIAMVAMAAGAIGGALLDQIHVQAGVLAYPQPWLADQPWWVAPQFGVGLLLVFVAATAVTRPRPGAPASVVDLRAVAVDAAWFVAVYVASGVWSDHPMVLTVAFAVTWIARRPDRVRRGVAFSVALAVGGVLYEGTLAATGAFHYAGSRGDLGDGEPGVARLVGESTPPPTCTTFRCGCPASICTARCWR